MRFIFSLLITLFFTYFSIPYLRRHFLVRPVLRSSHLISKPSAGGIVFVTLICLFSLFSGFYIPIFCLPLSIIGLIDDKYELKPYIRLISQIFTILLLINNSPFKDYFFYETNQIYNFIIVFLIVFISLGCINFINFVDGLDGLLTSCMIIIFLSIGIYLNINLSIIAGCLTGFLVLNWQPSKLFMGDVGSTFLGAFFVGILLFSGNLLDSFKILLLASPLLFDACISVIRRFLSGKSVIIPHKSFFFQRLNQGGLSHQKVALIYSTAIGLNGLALIFGNLYHLFLVILIEFLVAIVLEKKIAVKFN